MKQTAGNAPPPAMKSRPLVGLFMRLAYRADRLRRALSAPVSVGVRVLLVRDRQVLLVRHTYSPGLQLPGGGVKRGETLEQAARREAREEAGAEIGEMSLFGLYSKTTGWISDHEPVFLATDFELAEQHSFEIESCAFYSLDNLPADLVPSARRRIEEYRSGAGHVILGQR